MGHAATIVRSAIAAATVQDALNVQSLIKADLGGDYYRPLGDTWNNHGLMGASGSYDLKLIELTTNMQDAVIELLALQKFGSKEKIPYISPHEAAQALLAGLDERTQSELATVAFRESDPPASATKRLTAVFRDFGCGLTPDSVPRTIFRLGGSHKEDALHLQGAFGLGGAMTYRNAATVVLVTRRDPSLLPAGAEDRISVAVVEWHENTKGSTAMYLVDQPWNEAGDVAEPWSCLADEVPDFKPGMHLAMVSYRVNGFQYKTERDERSFNAVADTRLYDPVMPILFTNETDRGRRTTLRGLKRRLSHREPAFPCGDTIVPFNHGGTTYHLPVRYTLFEAEREAGGRDKFVAKDHAVIFTSNGQVHHHWSPQEFRNRTDFNKIYNRVLVVVETDELPIRVRTSLFTADRNELVRGDVAIRLEEAIVGALKGFDALRDQNNDLIRQSLRGTNNQQTADIARRIGRALNAVGFGESGGSGSGGGAGSGGGRSGGGGGSTRPIVLHPDPTEVRGVEHAQAERGVTKSLTFIVDVEDSFYDGRGQLTVSSDHPALSSREITVGRGYKGRVRVMVAVPDDADLGTFKVTAALKDWMKSSGGLGPELSWTTKLEVVDTIQGRGSGAGGRTTGTSGAGGPGTGTNIALRWTNPDHVESWERITVGHVEKIPAHVLAENADYQDLAELGDLEIPTIELNEEYPPFKKYLESRSRELTELTRPKEQFAYGVGVALMLIQKELETRRSKGRAIPDDSFVEEAKRAAARSVLAVMPQFDELAREAGVTSP